MFNYIPCKIFVDTNFRAAGQWRNGIRVCVSLPTEPQATPKSRGHSGRARGCFYRTGKGQKHEKSSRRAKEGLVTAQLGDFTMKLILSEGFWAEQG